jgi:lipopolysaccharide transport system ATP-binding protein
MTRSVISIENVSKMYRLGEVSSGTLRDDINRAWAKLRGKPDPFSTVGVSNQLESTSGDCVWALKDINLEIKEGEILGIIGGNGAGKSTLLKLLSRVTSPSAGRIRTYGRIVSLLEVGTGFHPELTGRENIYLNGAILGMARREITACLEQIVEFSGCAKYIDTPVKRYSSGMQVRLGFAVAAHLQCDILIVDEVLAVGDMAFQKKCMGWMQEVSATQQKTILFVSHNLDVIRQVCSTGIIIDNGELAYTGDIDSTIKRYLGNNGFDQVTSLEKSKGGGDGQVKITNLQIMNGNGALQAAMTPGGNYVFKLSYKVKNLDLLPISDIKAEVIFTDSLGDTVLLISTETVENNLTINHSQGVITAHLADLALAPGNYSISVYLGQSSLRTFDCLNKVLPIFVSGGDFFGNQHPGFAGQCKTLTRSQWSINDDQLI